MNSAPHNEQTMSYIDIAGQAVLIASISSTVAAIFAFFRQMTTKLSKTDFMDYSRKSEETHRELLSKQADIERRISEHITRAEMRTEIAGLEQRFLHEIRDMKTSIADIHRLMLQQANNK